MRLMKDLNLISIRGEDVFDFELKLPGDFEGERQTGIVAAGLDGIDGLAGNFEPSGQIGLAPTPLRTKFPEDVLHRPTMPRTIVMTAQADIITIQTENILSRGYPAFSIKP